MRIVKIKGIEVSAAVAIIAIIAVAGIGGYFVLKSGGEIREGEGESATGPTISNIQIEKGSDYATFYWTTDRPSDSRVICEPRFGFGFEFGVDNTLVTSHEITITGLDPQTTYYYQIVSHDAEGNIAETPAESIAYTFTTTPGTPEIVIASYTSSPVSSAYLDYFYLDDIEITLRNEGNAPAEVYKLILTIGGEEYTSFPWGTLDPKEEAGFTFSCWGSVDREIGVYSFTGRLEVQDSDYQTLLEQDLTFTIPTLEMGDTLPEVVPYVGDNFSFTPLWWVESDIAVVDWGGEISGHDYWTFTAKSNMKFVIFAFELKNNSIRVKETPYMNAGEIATDQGYIYPVWDSPSPYYPESDEYNPRESTEEEINNLIGDSASFKKLLPGESVVGCVVFEIPEGATPVEVDLAYIDPIVRFTSTTPANFPC